MDLESIGSQLAASFKMAGLPTDLDRVREQPYIMSDLKEVKTGQDRDLVSGTIKGFQVSLFPGDVHRIFLTTDDPDITMTWASTDRLWMLKDHFPQCAPTFYWGTLKLDEQVGQVSEPEGVEVSE